MVSGTAANRGYATVAPRSIGLQVVYTLENLGGISRACGPGTALGKGGAAARHFKVHVRHAADQVHVDAVFGRELFAPGDSVVYLQAEICREPLLVEVKATLFGAEIAC